MRYILRHHLKQQKLHYYLLLLTIIFVALISACVPNPGTTPTALNPPPDVLTATPASEPSQTPAPTGSPTPTTTMAPVITATWTVHSAKQITAPILLYHHIDVKDDRYFVSPETFRQQMVTLVSLGYTGITVPQMVDVLQHGGLLPERPVMVTFDDGDLDVYQNAYPILKELGLVATFYIVGTRLDADGFINAVQLKELISAGWAIGCHGMTHVDLTLNHDLLTYEAGICKSTLEKETGTSVVTFAYPYGSMDAYVAGKMAKYGYTSAVGLGISSEQSWGTLYYLSRLEVHNSYDMNAFVGLLPWKEPIQ